MRHHSQLNTENTTEEPGKDQELGSLSQAKTLGGVGSILTLLLIVPYNIGAILVVIGWIMTILAVKNISDTVQDKSIFNNALIAAIMAIIGTIVFAIVVAVAVLQFIGLGALSSGGTTVPPSDIVGLIVGLVGGLLVVWIVAIVGSFFLWRSYKGISARLNIGLFGTGALIYFIGSILTIVLVGFILIFVAQILFVIAFFSLPDNPPGAMPQQQQPIGPQPAMTT